MTKVPKLLDEDLSDRETLLLQLLREREGSYRNSVCGVIGCFKINRNGWLRSAPWESKKTRSVKTATEGALLGAVLANGVSPDLGIISDGAGQFRLLCHGLCWVHAERLINKLIPFTSAQRLAIETVQDQIWSLYQDLKRSKNLLPDQQQQQKAVLEARFDQIFTPATQAGDTQSSSETTQSTQKRTAQSFRPTRVTPAQQCQ